MHRLCEEIQAIAREEVELINDPAVKTFGMAMLQRWSENNYSNFCRDIWQTELKNFDPDKRNLASGHMLAIKDRIAELADSRAHREMGHRRSADAMKQETLSVYELIEQVGRGIVYFGSARTKPGERYFEMTKELAREVASLLSSTTWTGAGPGQMEAPHAGAAEVGGNVGGIKIVLDSERSAFEQNINVYLPSHKVVNCRFFGPRKIGLVDAAMREREEDRTGVVVTPGGFGTFDEFFEFLTLKQLQKLGSKHPVPIIVMNYDGFFDGMFIQMQRCIEEKTLNAKEMELFVSCFTNEEALDALALTYFGAERAGRPYTTRLKNWGKRPLPVNSTSAL